MRAGSHAYPAVVGSNVLEQAGAELARAGLRGRVRVVADELAWRCHGARLLEGLQVAGYAVAFTFIPSGETAKNLATLSEVYDWLLKVGVERGDCVLAFGGGVCGDLAGFAAATILRGVPLVQVPTTLLAQVDASIGGKTGIDHPRGKNLIGAFHQPRLVLADVGALATLPRRELAAGWAEVVKMAMILDAALFAELEAQPAALLDMEPALTARAIARSIELKGQVVAEDEREAERRMVLNYGHTIGHAIEAVTGYDVFLHGEAVAIGMVGASLLAERMGLLSPADRARQDALIAALGLPCSCPGLRPEALWMPMLQDKKARSHRLTWVLAPGPGQVALRRDVPTSLVDAVLHYLTTSTESPPVPV
ncbi:MAG: 3-dehydroquinate synthase [Chloroflexi bacterium]|nr:3-dehydroquinate synthase [Chloroflexota bacterium]